MTDPIDQATDVDDIDSETPGRDRRRLFIAGAGLAGAAAIVGKSGTASATDDDEVLVGNPNNETDDGATVITNTNNTASTPGTPGQEAIVGTLTGAANGSHAIKGVTAGLGHSVAGDTPAGDNTVAATWGRHGGDGAGVGVNSATDIDIAGPARGVEGLILDPTNGSHAVFGKTTGGGHSVAGDTSADAAGPEGVGTNTTAATWGRHGGIGAGIGGISANGCGGEFKGGKAPGSSHPRG